MAKKPAKFHMWLVAGIALTIAVLDQVTKHILVENLGYGEKIPVIDGFFYIVHVVNRGAAWGILSGRMNLLSLISILVFVIMIVYFRKFSEGYLERVLGLALMLGGVLGNLIDRLDLIPRSSNLVGVVDFFSFQYASRGWEFPAFNIADMGITVGVGIYCISSFLRKQQEPDDKHKPWSVWLKETLRP